MRRKALLLGLALGCASPAAYPPPPETRSAPVVDTIHGVDIEDPYRWLEDQESAETRAWIDAQNAYAQGIVGESPLRARLRSRLGELLRPAEAEPPRKGGEHEYFTLRRDKDELPVLYRRPAPKEDGELTPIGPSGGYELVLDPHPMSPEHMTRVELLAVSEDGKRILVGIRRGGEDEIELRVRDVEKGDLPDRLPRALYRGISFEKGGSGFYYTHRSREDGPRVRFHRLGTPVSEDREIFGSGFGPTTFIEAMEVENGKALVFVVNHGWARSELHFQDLANNGPATVLVAGEDARFYPQLREGILYVRTNLGAPRNRILAIDPRNPGRERWKEVVPEGEDVLSAFAILGDRIYASYLHHGSTRIRIHGLDGSSAGEIPIPDHHTAELRGAGKGKALLTLTSFTLPPATYLLDLKTLDRTPWEERAIDFDASAFTVRQVRYRSKDGTEVPMYLFHKKELDPGPRPTLLFGYGGFNAAQTPRFDPVAALWVEEGGIFAMANLRGGSEYGENWHRAGMLENKQNVFDDFIAAAEFLVSEGHTSKDKLAIRGISNGGLLVASAFTQRPELFRAVLCGFPDLDMVRFTTFVETNNLPALLEYGDASKPDEFEFLRRYSPYQAVREGTRYPAVMLTSGDRDTRVPPLQARKMTARLQAASSSGLPVILRYHAEAGHAANYGMPVTGTIEDLAMELSFLLQQLGASADSGS